MLEKDKKLLECCIEVAQSQNKETTRPSYANQKLVKSYLYIRSYLETEVIEEETESKEIFKRLTEFEKSTRGSSFTNYFRRFIGCFFYFLFDE